MHRTKNWIRMFRGTKNLTVGCVFFTACFSPVEHWLMVQGLVLFSQHITPSMTCMFGAAEPYLHNTDMTMGPTVGFC